MFHLAISPPLTDLDIFDYTILEIYLSPTLGANLDGNHSSLARKSPNVLMTGLSPNSEGKYPLFC